MKFLFATYQNTFNCVVLLSENNEGIWSCVLKKTPHVSLLITRVHKSLLSLPLGNRDTCKLETSTDDVGLNRCSCETFKKWKQLIVGTQKHLRCPGRTFRVPKWSMSKVKGHSEIGNAVLPHAKKVKVKVIQKWETLSCRRDSWTYREVVSPERVILTFDLDLETLTVWLWAMMCAKTLEYS